ncbi:ankyrin [Coniophora puteana RWD-64-598 SS2]|uniref:Ankyrin n=1 Tax=Coniophora puteana (strain RWD-64-598) TaxID=741705 RepID=A0A5M3MSL3_CONPW|nr:ankyrin [Coniophora puteana RWD-64-598 SS2]EIW82086.1 ankyrin [Coniophora puteana RWD-64-598 SS2]
MVEKDATERLRRAIKENNLFLAKRLIQRTDMRNPDPGPRRFTSLAWTAALGHEETFEFLLNAGHDDDELSRDAEGNTVLMLLADFKPPPFDPYAPGPSEVDLMGACLRMARMYYERYPSILDWSNVGGKTAIHFAALRGNEELVRMLCDWRADIDLPDGKGNTPLHYASSWGHIPVVQILIERGCAFYARNNEGFLALDYAYSFSTQDTMNDARQHAENSKRRMLVPQNASYNDLPPPLSLKHQSSPRLRSGSGGSRTTNTSDSNEPDSAGFGVVQATSLSSVSAASSNSHLPRPPHSATVQGTPSQPNSLTPSSQHTSSLSPIVTRMRERDADAIKEYMRRNRSGSGENDDRSRNGTQYSYAGPAANGDDFSGLGAMAITGSTTPRRRLRPSFSAAQLRTSTTPVASPNLNTGPTDARTRAGTNPPQRSHQLSLSPLPILTRTTSSDLPRIEDKLTKEPEKYTGPPSQYAKFPDPPAKAEKAERENPVSAIGRRLPFNLLSKPLSSSSHAERSGQNHRRGSSAQSARG